MSDAIGVSRPRLDSREKVTGATRYAADDQLVGLLHARLVLSTEPHARITGIDSSQALEVPGVVAVLTAHDLPIAAHGADRAREPLARSEVVFSGQPVAMVVAESEAAAEDGVEAVVVDYEPLDAVVDVEAGMAPGAPLAQLEAAGEEGSGMGSAHTDVEDGEVETDAEELSPNVTGRGTRRDGDVEAAFAESDAVVSGRFETPWMYQAYLEPQTTTAWIEPGDRIVVSTSTQGAFATRRELADVFGLPLDKIRVRPAPLGGAFGGKFAMIEPLVVGPVLALRRPVRLVLTRSEDFQMTNPAPAEIIELRVGGKRDGKLTALEARIVADRGALTDWGVEGISSTLVAGPYRWQAHRIEGYGVRTNRVSFGAYRAPGATPSAFALETLLDELADQLDVDPIELRLQNSIREGDTSVTGSVFPPMGVRECLERVREHPIWQERGSLPDDEGVGVAIGYWPGGLEPSSALCRLDGDGTLNVITAAVDMSGTDTTFAAIAAEAFGLPLDRVRVVSGDTDSAPYTGSSGGSKITYTVGRAVQKAAEAARERLLQTASEELEIAAGDLEIADGVVRAVGAPIRSVQIAELARQSTSFGGRHEPIEGHGGSAQRSQAPGTACHVSHVRVDPETGEVHVLRHAIAQDVGRALNPALVEGQMRGGTAQAIGWALFEELRHDDYGQLVSGSFLEYAVPTAERVPPIDTLFVEVPAPDGPFGARGVGEPPVIAGPAAIANAIAAAAGIRPRRLPMTAPRVWSLLQEHGGTADGS